MFRRRLGAAISHRLGRTCLSLGMATLLLNMASGQIIYQEGFNDDGDGTRYTMEGRGQLIGPDGPGAWEHNFLVDAIGFPAAAAGKRAGILWTNNATDEDFTTESLQIWDNLVNYMMDDKENATIGILGDTTTPTGEFLSLRWEDQGHDIFPIANQEELPGVDEVDLLIHMEGFAPPSPASFVDYAVPVITYNAGNHDDILISSIGATTSGGPTVVTAVGDHPVLGGLTGEIPWVDEFIEGEPLSGIGASVASGATTLATYVDPATSVELAALVIIEKDATLLGAFAPVPEGAGYIIGGDMNLDLGNGEATAEVPKSVTLNPIDVSGQSGVQVSVDLAATTVDFEPPDFLRVSYAPDEEAEFVTLADFLGEAGSLVDAELGALNAEEFTTFTFDIPDDVSNLVLKFEAFSTFPNEVLGIDNVVVFVPGSCDPNSGGDLDGSGTVDFADFLTLSGNFGNAVDDHTAGDIDCSGTVDFADFLTLSGNFGKAVGGAESVPEPSSLMLLGFVSLFGGLIRRRRRI